MTPGRALEHDLVEELPRLRRYAFSLMRGSEQADDLVQRTILRALEKQHLWQPGTDLRAWLFTLMHSQYVDFIRKAVREGRHLRIESARGLGYPAPQIDRLLLRDLQRAFERLPDEQREVVRIIGMEGMAYEEAAAILRLPIGTVRSRLSRARETLRSVMDVPELRRTQPRRARADGLANVACRPA